MTSCHHTLDYTRLWLQVISHFQIHTQLVKLRSSCLAFAITDVCCCYTKYEDWFSTLTCFFMASHMYSHMNTWNLEEEICFRNRFTCLWSAKLFYAIQCSPFAPMAFLLDERMVEWLSTPHRHIYPRPTLIYHNVVWNWQDVFPNLVGLPNSWRE